MPVMEMFFDYSCPYCLKGHNSLLELIKDYPQITMKWCPCEAHPRPEPGPHSDLCLQALLFAIDEGADQWAFHKRMYDAFFGEKKLADRESIDEIAAHVADLVDADKLKAALQSKKYEEAQQGINDYAYEQSGVWAVPSFRMDGHKLDAVEGVGVTTQQLKDFMDLAK